MAPYDTLFSQLDVTSSQLLVTDNDFKNANFRVQLGQTVNSLLALRIIPIFNENDAISTRKAPYEVLLIRLAGTRSRMAHYHMFLAVVFLGLRRSYQALIMNFTDLLIQLF
ncbi:delta-1-pyrroline-5-carboxylate synthase-like [Apium graveolens]|uniref:delta-1-pyrroline-5-carboxylate synthase-like n=1 Tax=Apium graveolens TaxID=4045 RepID=UPI003D7A7FBE